jgi:glycosyltransferase involved in cell wall biosynthesis
MKILMLNYEFPPLGGGAGNANYYFLKRLAKKREIKIDLITSSISKFKKERFSKNINIYYLNIAKNKNKIHFQTTKDLIIYSFKAYFFAKKLIKKNDYDLIHAWFGIPCGFLALLLRKTYIVSLRGSDVPFHNPRFEILDKFLFKHLSKIVWRKAKLIVANSEGLKKLAQKTSPKQKIEVVYNGIDTQEFKPLKNKKNSKKLKIIFMGRLAIIKGIDYLLKALGKLKSKDFTLTLIGDGKEKENLKELAENLKIDKKVKFLGSIPHRKILKYYQESDLFVLPSLNEGMSNTLLEAMAVGLPVIATNTGGSKELIKENGFIVDKASSNGLKNVIQKFIDNPTLIKNAGKVSRSLAKEMSWKKVAAEYMEVYKK